MATKREIDQIQLPEYVASRVTDIYEDTADRGYGVTTKALREYLTGSVLGDDGVHPVAKASLATAMSNSLVDGDTERKHHPVRIAERKLNAMQALLRAMRPNSLILLESAYISAAVRNLEDPQLHATVVEEDNRVRAGVWLPVAGAVQVKVDSLDPYDIEISPLTQSSDFDSIHLDGNKYREDFGTERLTGVRATDDVRVNKVIPVGVARDEEIPQYIQQVLDAEPAAGTSVRAPDTVIKGLSSLIAVRSVMTGTEIELPVIEHDVFRTDFSQEIAHAIISMAARQEHREGQSYTNYCCPSHGDVTRFRSRQNKIASWTVDELGIVLDSLGMTIADIKPEPKSFDTSPKLGELVDDEINHQAVTDVFKAIEARLAF